MGMFLVDDLEKAGLDPSVETRRLGDDVEVSVRLNTADDHEVDALEHAIVALKTAFHAAGIGTAGLIAPRDLRSRVLPLQPA